MASTQYHTTTVFCCPTENDVNGGVSGYGDVLQELTFGALLAGLDPFARGRVISGFDLPSSGSASGRELSGAAIVAGKLVQPQSGGKFTVSFPYATNHIFLRLLRLSDVVSEVVIQIHDDTYWRDELPTDSIKLGSVTTSGGSITGALSEQFQGRIVFGRLYYNGSDAPYASWSGSGDWKTTFSSPTTYIYFCPAFRREPALVLGSEYWTIAADEMHYSSLPTGGYFFALIG